MHCANGHDNSLMEIFCIECREVMPPLTGVRPPGQIRWIADLDSTPRATRPEATDVRPEPVSVEAEGVAVGDAGGRPATRAELRRRRHGWRRRRLRRRSKSHTY